MPNRLHRDLLKELKRKNDQKSKKGKKDDDVHGRDNVTKSRLHNTKNK